MYNYLIRSFKGVESRCKREGNYPEEYRLIQLSFKTATVQSILHILYKMQKH